MLTRRFYQFGPFRVDAEKRVLLRGGEIVPLKAKAFDALLVLVQHHGEVLEKDDLMEMLWPDSDVEESNLPQHISALRKTLGEGPNERRYIVTVPGRGYRFAAEVEEFDDESQDLIVGRYTQSTVVIEQQEREGLSVSALGPTLRRSFNRRKPVFVSITVGVIAAIAIGLLLLRSNKTGTPSGPAQPSPNDIRSLAVLPFKHLDTIADEEYLGVGIADTLITKLSSLTEILVRPTSSVVKYSTQDKEAIQIGRELGVESVLDGSIRKSGERVRVTVRLLRVEDGSPLWAEKFDERFTDIFAVEDSISERVAELLLLKLTGERRELLVKHGTENVEAYQLCLKGKYFRSQRTLESIQKGIGYFQKAITIDPNYALAYAGLSQAYSMLPITSDVPTRDILPAAKQAVTKALEIDDTLVEAHLSLAGIKFWMEWDWQGAEKECRRTIELNPNHPEVHSRYAQLLSNLGRHPEAIAEARRALELDPVSPGRNLFLGQYLYQARQYDQAIEQLHHALEIAPNDWVAHLNLGKIYVQQKKYAEAIGEFQKSRESSVSNTETIAVMGHALAVSGRRDEAQKVLEELMRLSKQRYVPPYNIAIAYLGLGKKEEALGWLERAYGDRDVRLVFLKVEPKWDVLRADQRFIDLIGRVGL